MDREYAKHLSEVLKAYSEGEPVQFKVFKDSVEPWKEINDSKIEELIYNKVQLRIKPEPKYRPYKNAEEFLKAQKEHGLCFKWIGTKSFHFPNKIDDCTLKGEGFHISYSNLLERCIWQDGTPCGILE